MILLGMDDDKKQAIFEDKYQKILGLTYPQWLEQGPQTEKQAYAWLNQIDAELNANYDAWFNATGETKDRLQEKRDRLKALYDLIEETFNLEIAEIEK